MDVWAVEVEYYIDHVTSVELCREHTIYTGSERAAEQCAERLSRYALLRARREHGADFVYGGILQLRILVDAGGGAVYIDS